MSFNESEMDDSSSESKPVQVSDNVQRPNKVEISVEG